MRKKSFVFMVLIFTAMIRNVSAQMSYDPVTTYQPSPVNGSWEISFVSAEAPGGSSVEADPEDSPRLFSELPDLLVFSPDGIGQMQWRADEKVVYGRWSEEADTVMMTGNVTRGYQSYGELYEPDLTPGHVMELRYDKERNLLHYQQSGNTRWDAVYRRTPNGAWRMNQIIKRQSESEPVILDPEQYAESKYVYFIHSGGLFSLWIPDEASGLPVYKDGSLEVLEDRYLLKTDDDELELIYDDRTNQFHRYVDVDDPGADPYSVEFVYYNVPVLDAWKMKTIINGADQSILDPAAEEILYHENYYDYYFFTDGSALASIPGIIEDRGIWTLRGNELVIFYDDGSEMHFDWDSNANILHRYAANEEKNAAYPFLDFVYLYR